MGIYKKLYLSCAVIVILALFSGFSVRVCFSGNTTHRKVFLIGLDGATWDVISPMISKGDLPNIQRLMREGSHGILRSEAPTRSPAIWTTMVTGKNRREHGIVDFTVRLEKGAGGSVPVTSNIRKVKALWNILTENGISSGVVNWWASWPAEKVDGFIVSDRAFYKGVQNTTYPPVLQDRLALLPGTETEFLHNEINRIFDVAATPYKRNLFVNIFKSDDPLMHVPPRVFDKDTFVFEIGDYFYKEFAPDFYALYFKGADILSHRYWKYFMPDSARWRFKPSDGDIKRYGNVIPEYYRYIDRIIGEIVKLGDDATTIFIVSDHGFGPRPGEGGLDYNFNFILEKLGLLRYKKGANKEIDYDKSIIYNDALPWRNAKLFLNFKKNKSNGMLNCKDYYSLVENIRERLRKIKTVRGRKLFNKIRVGKKSGNCFDADKPDLLTYVNNKILPDREIIINGKLFSTSDFIFYRGLYGSHQIPVQKTDGIIIMSGKNIKQGKKTGNATIYDITPTILYLFGLPLARDMKGVILKEAVEKDLLRSNPPQYITTFEDLKPGKKTEDKPIKSPADEDIKEKLRALGYVIPD